MSDIKPQFELTAPRSAEAEKRIEAGTKNLDLYLTMNRRAKAEFFGTVFLIGNELNELAVVMPHGELEAFIRERYQLADSTQQRWRQMAEGVIAKAHVRALADAKSPTVGLLKGKALILSGKRKFNKKERSLILEIVPEIMERKGLVDFMEDCGLVKPAEEPGGYRPDPEKLKKWLVKHYPELAEKPFADLPPKVQREFTKFDLGSRERRNAHDVALEQKESLLAALVPAIVGKWLMQLTAEERAEVKRAVAKLMDKLNSLEAKPV